MASLFRTVLCRAITRQSVRSFTSMTSSLTRQAIPTMTTSFKVPTLLTQISRNFHLKRKANPRKHVGAKYKNKSHRATMKRFKVTGTGRIMRWRAGKRHLARNKSKRQLRGLSKRVDVPKQLYKRYKQSMLF